LRYKPLFVLAWFLILLFIRKVLEKIRHTIVYILLSLIFVIDIHMFVHRNIIPNYSQQNSTFLDLFIFTDTLNISGGSSTHHQEHITVHIASGIVNQYCC
jgi:hypothetical protein